MAHEWAIKKLESEIQTLRNCIASYKKVNAAHSAHIEAMRHGEDTPIGRANSEEDIKRVQKGIDWYATNAIPQDEAKIVELSATLELLKANQ